MAGSPGDATRPAPAAELPEHLRRLGASLIDYLRGHLELLQVELAQERARLTRLLARAIALVLGAFFCLQSAALLVVAVFWDGPWRLHAVGGLLLAALAGFVLIVIAWQRIKAEHSELFKATAAELQKDRRMLEELK